MERITDELFSIILISLFVGKSFIFRSNSDQLNASLDFIFSRIKRFLLQVLRALELIKKRIFRFGREVILL